MSWPTPYRSPAWNAGVLVGAPDRQGERRYGPRSSIARSVGAYPCSSACSSWARPTPSRWSNSMRRPEGRGARAWRPPPATGRRRWRTSPWTSRERAPSSTHASRWRRPSSSAKGFLRGLRKPAEPLAGLVAQGIGQVANHVLRLLEGTRHAQRELGPQGAVALHAGGLLDLRRHFTDDLVVLLRLQPVVFAELRFRALDVRLADEVLVLRRLALDRGGAPVVAASLACLLGHREPSSCGQKCRNREELAQCGRRRARVAFRDPVDRLHSRPWDSSSPARPTSGASAI